MDRRTEVFHDRELSEAATLTGPLVVEDMNGRLEVVLVQHGGEVLRKELELVQVLHFCRVYAVLTVIELHLADQSLLLPRCRLRHEPSGRSVPSVLQAAL